MVYMENMYIMDESIYCVSKKVDGDYYRHECNRCGHVWYSTTADPKTCASHACKSPYWNKERVR